MDGALYDAQNGRAAKILELSEAPHLRGVIIGRMPRWLLPPPSLLSRMCGHRRCHRQLSGLAHRMEDVGRIGKTLFINDFKATNADAAARALAVYPDIFWIAGGKPKDGGIESLAPLFFPYSPCLSDRRGAHVFSRTLDGKAPYEVSGTLDAAVVRRRAMPPAGSDAAAPVVATLLPACASYDQFKDFEQRGEAFRAAVTRLPLDVKVAS